MSSTNPEKSINPLNKKRIDKNFEKIIKTVTKINKGNNEMKTFKRNKSKSILFPGNNLPTSSIFPNINLKENNFSTPNTSSDIKSQENSISKEDSINLIKKENNNQKLANTEFSFLSNFLKKKMDKDYPNVGNVKKNNFYGNLKQSMATGYSGLKTSLGTGYTGLKDSMAKGYTGLKSSMDTGYTGLKSSMDTGNTGLKSSMDTGYTGLKSSMDTGYTGLKSSLGKGYDISKQFIVDKTNPEKNVNINISKIKEITQLVKNDCIYIDITNLIGDYNFSVTEKNYFNKDKLLNTIIYSIISNNKDNKNRIIYFTRNNNNIERKIFMYNVNEKKQYIYNVL
jgi:hypothetical protein